RPGQRRDRPDRAGGAAARHPDRRRRGGRGGRHPLRRGDRPLRPHTGVPRAHRARRRPRRRSGEMRPQRDRAAPRRLRDGPRARVRLPIRRNRLRDLPGGRHGQGLARPDPARRLRGVGHALLRGRAMITAAYPVISPASIPDGLLAAVEAYEAALLANDVTTLDTLFAPGSDTIRGDGTTLLVGHDAITEFRVGRTPIPTRRIVELHVRPVGADAALVMASTVEPQNGATG